MRELNSIAVIPDGNRRFAKERGISLAEAYACGVQNFFDASEWASEAGVSSITFWALSLDNFNKRSQIELKVVFSLIKSKMREALEDERLADMGARVKFFGRRDLLPTGLDSSLKELEAATADYSGCDVNIGIAYSGREELVRAARLAAEAFAKGEITCVDEEAIESRLYNRIEPDLIIRTGRTPHLSGFMPWQSCHSELYFSDSLWPEFDKQEFERALDFYSATESRRGK
jgi:undecaprenyl diphosphate synthase